MFKPGDKVMWLHVWASNGAGEEPEYRYQMGWTVVANPSLYKRDCVLIEREDGTQINVEPRFLKKEG